MHYSRCQRIPAVLSFAFATTVIPKQWIRSQHQIRIIWCKVVTPIPPQAEQCASTGVFLIMRRRMKRSERSLVTNLHLMWRSVCPSWKCILLTWIILGNVWNCFIFTLIATIDIFLTTYNEQMMAIFYLWKERLGRFAKWARSSFAKFKLLYVF